MEENCEKKKKKVCKSSFNSSSCFTDLHKAKAGHIHSQTLDGKQVPSKSAITHVLCYITKRMTLRGWEVLHFTMYKALHDVHKSHPRLCTKARVGRDNYVLSSFAFLVPLSFVITYVDIWEWHFNAAKGFHRKVKDLAEAHSRFEKTRSLSTAAFLDYAFSLTFHRNEIIKRKKKSDISSLPSPSLVLDGKPQHHKHCHKKCLCGGC